jgi:hypothetical protein
MDLKLFYGEIKIVQKYPPINFGDKIYFLKNMSPTHRIYSGRILGESTLSADTYMITDKRFCLIFSAVYN